MHRQVGPQPESASHRQTERSGPGDGQKPLAVLSLELVEMKQRLGTAEARIHELERRMESTLDRLADAHAGETVSPEASEAPSPEEADRPPAFAEEADRLPAFAEEADRLPAFAEEADRLPAFAEEADRLPAFASLISELRRTIAERVDDVDVR
jgi:hypothetical protein